MDHSVRSYRLSLEYPQGLRACILGDPGLSPVFCMEVNMDALRMMPQSKGAEAALLASMMLMPEIIPQVQKRAKGESFFTHAHKRIYETVTALYAAEGAVDGLLVRQCLESHEHLEEIGGVEYLERVLHSVPSPASWEHYLKIVADMASRRQAIESASAAIDAAYDLSLEPGNAVAKAHERLFEAIEVLRPQNDTASLGSLVEEAFMPLLDGKKKATGLATGFHELDDLIIGFQPGDLIILAARPSIGKTALLIAFLDTIAIRDKVPAALFSLEMSKMALTERIMCSHAGVSLTRTHKGILGRDEKKRMANSISDYEGVQWAISDRTPQTVYEIAAAARELKQQHDIQLICIDYLQLMYMPGRSESRQLEIASISRELKGLARSLDVPVIALSQLNREVESRDKHRPRTSDLRESGALEQDADLILLLHREDAYHRDDGPPEYGPDGKIKKGYQPDGIGEIIVAKQRQGPSGLVKVLWRPEMLRFVNMSQAEEPQT